MKSVRFGLGMVLAIGLSACQQQEEPAGPVGRLPEQACTQARTALDKASKSAGFEYTGAEATIAESGWRAMNPDQQQALAQALAFNAACQAPEAAAETTILIRNESGLTLMERTIGTTIDLSDVLRE